MTTNEIFNELYETHWRWTHSWWGLELSKLVVRYKLPREKILSILRDIATRYPSKTAQQKGTTPCKSCGMPIIFKVIAKTGNSHPLNPQQRKILVNGRFVEGHESHFAACPDAEWWRNSSEISTEN